MRICHFEDAKVAMLEPLALSRPAFDLRCGINTLGEKQRRFFQSDETGALVRPLLVESVVRDNPGAYINDFDWLGDGLTVLVNARWLPPAKPPTLDPENLAADGPFVAMLGDEIAYAVLTPDELEACTYVHLAHCFEQWKQTLPNRPAGGQLVRYLWDLVDSNVEQLALDFQATRPAELIGRPPELTLIGPSDWLRVHPTARIDPFVVADTSNGPIFIDRDTVISSFTRIEGPCWIGPRTQVLGANLRGGVSIGPNCRIGGEVEATIIQGNTNKYHTGFLGHSYLGEWVNLGAGTHTSDLRCDYGEVRMMINGVLIPSGRRKIGCYLGDHTKTGLGSLLNTGTNVGVFGNLLPSGELLPRFVPSFCWVEQGRISDRGDLAVLFTTAERAMERRGEEFSDAQRSLYQALHEKSAHTRRQTINEGEFKRLRRAG